MKQATTGTTFKGGHTDVTQSMIERMESMSGRDIVPSNVAKVIATYPKAMTCDIETSNGMIVQNVPVMTRCGLIEEEVFGVLDLPEIDSYVLVMQLGDRESFPIIIGTLIPYNNKLYQGSQVPVNSADKQFTLKLLEDVSDKVYRRIFKSGTTVEVQEDGTIILETPDGTYIKIDSTNSEITVEDINTNKIILNSDGINIDDANGNNIEMGSSSVMINGNLEVLQ
jgi:hypothetical protein